MEASKARCKRKNFQRCPPPPGPRFRTAEAAKGVAISMEGAAAKGPPGTAATAAATKHAAQAAKQVFIHREAAAAAAASTAEAATAAAEAFEELHAWNRAGGP